MDQPALAKPRRASPRAPAPPGYYTLDQAAQELGMGRRALQRVIERGEIAAYRPSRIATYLPVREVERWRDERTLRAVPPSARPRRRRGR